MRGEAASRSDAELVADVLAGDRAPFADLVRRHERSTRAAAFAVLGDHDDASDVAQEAFLQAFQRLHTLQDGAAFGPWVRSIARHRALTQARRRVKAASLEEAQWVACQPTGEYGPDADLLPGLIDAVQQLPEHEQSVVMLYYFDDQNVRQISQITGRPLGTVTMQMSRARQRLRAWLKEQEP